LGNISINDTYIITPAENPSDVDKTFVFVLDVKKDIKEPMPVASPANNVSKKANNTLEFSIIIP